MLPLDSKYRQWDSIEKLAYKFAHMVHGRVIAARLGHRVQFEDLSQDAALTWMKACDSFDPEYGVKFTTFLSRAIITNLNRLVDKNDYYQHGVTAFVSSIDQPAGHDDDGLLQEILDGNTVYQPDIMLEMQDAVSEKLDTLSGAAKIIYELILVPPDWLVEEFTATREQAKIRRSLGHRPGGQCPTDIVVMEDLARKIWNISVADFRGIRTEIWRIQHG